MLFAATLLLGLCGANAVNFTTVYEWDKFDFLWPPEADTSIGQIKQNFTPDNVEFRYMAVYGERLFLSLDTDPGIPTSLVWLPTNGTSTAPPKLAPFPSLDLHKKDICDNIQAAGGLETDTDGRLWVLDDGSDKCPGKLWIFNLLKNDQTERVHQFPDTVVSHFYLGRSLSDLVLDKTTDDLLAYITDARSEQIVVYSRKMDKSWSVKTPSEGRWFSLALSPNREARHELYLRRAGSNELYSVSVSELKNEGGSAAVKFIGQWTGKPYKMLIDGANVLYAASWGQDYLSKWIISQPFREQRFYEVGELGAYWPFTFALDANGNLWMTELNVNGGGNRHKLLKAAVGARSNSFSKFTATKFLDETSEQEITGSSLDSESTPPGETQSPLGVLFNSLWKSRILGKTLPHPQRSISLPFLILLQTFHCLADPADDGKNSNLFPACGNVRFPGQQTFF
ncbi:protein yellow-like [Cloeon dipterum]|uniref:protein yellow-like n=1 Tax=Cloeon dipterum TaxID=197152 RepID=UPI00321F97F1